jgi:hypothetical protein
MAQREVVAAFDALRGRVGRLRGLDYPRHVTLASGALANQQ